MPLDVAYLRGGVFAISVILLQLVFWPGTAAHAAPLFAVRVDPGDITAISSAPVSRAMEFLSPIVAGNFYTRSASAAADRGYLRASAHGNIFFPDMREVQAAPLFNRAEAVATFQLDDVIITGPSGSVETALRLHLSGGVSANAFARNLDGAGNEAVANATVRVTGNVNGSQFGGIQSRGAVWNVLNDIGGSSVFEDGIFAGFGGSDDITSPLMTLPVNTPFSMTLSLSVAEETIVSASGFGGLPVERKAEALASFSNTLSFPLIGEVFDLPDGYTVNSVAGLIVNNGWEGAPLRAVPTPSSNLLFGVGLLALAGFGFMRLKHIAEG